MKIKTKALARKLTNDKLKEIYGEEAIWKETIDEFQGFVYKDEVKSDADLLFKYFLQEIHDHIKYPFKEGETYYTIIKSGKRYDIQENVWNDVSEEMYRSHPDTKFFEKESQAYNYISQLKNEEQINLLKNAEKDR
tara:strand:+ start:1316 stop:1723 length:408 start_codon:yes stop_codon:yes gene_type:complete